MLFCFYQKQLGKMNKIFNLFCPFVYFVMATHQTKGIISSMALVSRKKSKSDLETNKTLT